MNITNELINEIRNKIDIVEIISNYVPLTQRGKNYFGVCPFHDDHSPSMSVSKEKQIYTCFSCGATGNVFTFVSEYEHINFYEAVKLLGNKIGYNLLNQMIRELKEKLVKSIFLEVRSCNEKALGFYYKYGFKKISTRANYYSDGTNAEILKYIIP